MRRADIWRNSVFRSSLFGLAWVSVVWGGGCGGSALPPRARVEGQVTLDGTPLTSGTVMFVPDAGQGTSGPPAIGFLDAQGHYRLTTDRDHPGDGAVIGVHKVSIEARESAEPGAVSKPLAPPAYANPETSGLSGRVQAGQVNRIDFALSSGSQARR